MGWTFIVAGATMKRLVGSRLLIILTLALLGAVLGGNFGDPSADSGAQVLAQVMPSTPTPSWTQSAAGGAGKPAGTESFDNVKTLDINLNSAVVELRRNNSGTPKAVISWRISCEDSQGAGHCDPADLKIEFKVEHGVLRIWDTFQPRRGQVRPKLEITVSHGSNQPIKANIQNGIFQATSPPRLELFLGNGSASLLGDLKGSSVVSIKNGSLDIDCLLSKGKHEIKIENGSAEARFKKGSSFKYDARVQTGSVGIERAGQASSDEDFMDRAEGAIGGGAGELKIEIGVGSVDLAFL